MPGDLRFFIPSSLPNPTTTNTLDPAPTASAQPNSSTTTIMSSSRASADGNAATTSFRLLTATYDSPTNAAFTYNHKLSAPATSDTTDRVAYLAALRKSTAELQERINTELTQRMEEDKARDATGAAVKGKKNGVLDEGKEEENYGEEVVNED